MSNVICPYYKACQGEEVVCPHGTPHVEEPECHDPVDLNCPNCVEIEVTI